jgi:hypothetical protein
MRKVTWRFYYQCKGLNWSATRTRLSVLPEKDAACSWGCQDVTQRWAKSGMPVTHERRRVHGSPDELNRWLERPFS